MYRHFSLPLTIGSFLIAVGAFAQESDVARDTRAQQIRFVDETGVDSGDCTDPENPCATVGFAVEQAGSGDVIEIAVGTYIESITLDKNLTLQGQGEENTTLRASTATGSRDRVITIVPGLEVSISGVTISHGWAASWSTPSSLGGGIYNEESELTLMSVTLFRNKTTSGGGAGVANVNASGTFSNVTFRENFTDSSGGQGGGLLNVESDPVLVNVAFTGNAAERGGGMFNNGSSPLLTNATFHNNIGEIVGGGLFNAEQSAPHLLNSIVVGHLIGGPEGIEIFNDETSTIELEYSLYGDSPGAIVEGGGFETSNTQSADPFAVFRFPYQGNLRLREDSPAIDAGDPNTDLALFPVNDEGEPIDLDGNPRVFSEAIDIGAYEHQGLVSMAGEASMNALAEVLSAPSPNPVRRSASFTITVERGQEVTVEVYDALGRRVKTLYEGSLTAEMSETLMLDASVLPAGVYLIRATGEDFINARRFIIVH